METYTIAELQNEDLPLVKSLTPEKWSDITPIHEFYLGNASCHPIKVIGDNKEIAGIGTAIDYRKTGWLAHIIVSEKFRRRGIGTLIVDNRIAYLRQKCACATVTLTATSLGYPVYKRYGFADQSRYCVFLKKQETAPMKISDKIVPLQKNHFEEVFRIDEIASGENRAGLLSPVLNRGFVFLSGDRVDGYYLPGFGDGGIVAMSNEAGIELLKMKIARADKIFVPEENIPACDFLSGQGFEEADRIHRMIYGNPFPQRQELVYSRIGGFAG